MNRRILILAPRGRDAQVVEQVLSRGGVSCHACADAQEFCTEIGRGAGAAVLTEESLLPSDMAALTILLERQPSWADFPFILLSTSRGGGQQRTALRELTDRLGNVVVLERPINAETLMSAAVASLRARDRQYEAQQHWLDRESDEKRLRMALEAGNLGSWTLDLPCRTLSGSDRFKAHFGREPSDPLTYDDVIASVHPDDRAKQRAALDTASAREIDYRLEFRAIWPDQTVHWIQLSGRTVLSGQGGLATMSGVSLDVTERRRSEELLKQRVSEAVSESQRAQAALVQAQKMEAVGHLTGGIAHDFNNLLTAIVGNIDLIGRRTSDERIRIMADRARHASDRAAKLTSQLLAFSRSQKLDLRPVKVDLLIRGMRDLMARSIGPSVEIRTELNAPDQAATADANQLELALLNLAINARDAMPNGGLLTIGTRRVEAPSAAGPRDGHVVISVTDTGSGIPADILPKVFDPFFTTKAVGKGTGLGLSQVHGIAHQSGGTVRIESEIGRGTTIEIWLRASDDLGWGVGVEEADDRLHMGRGRVLVVDDDADVRGFVVECLETLGFSVTQADHGRAGLERLERDRPDLLIVDFAMPGMNGAQVAAAARQQRADLPIILATGYADTGAIEGTFSNDAILRKPFQIQDLSRAIRHALDQDRAGTSLVPQNS